MGGARREFCARFMNRDDEDDMTWRLVVRFGRCVKCFKILVMGASH